MPKPRPETGSRAELDHRRASTSHWMGSQAQLSPGRNMGAQPHNVPLEEGLGTEGTDLPAWVNLG